jgi:hypothetical protein
MMRGALAAIWMNDVPALGRSGVGSKCSREDSNPQQWNRNSDFTKNNNKLQQLAAIRSACYRKRIVVMSYRYRW